MAVSIMSDTLDPYRVWLGIPPESRPPTHYELLGISPNGAEKGIKGVRNLCSAN